MNRLGRDMLWGDAGSTAWTEIDNAVQAEVARIRVAQLVFPTIQMPGASAVSNDQFTSATMTITEGQTLPFVEISLEFALTDAQVANEASLHTGRTLAVLAAKTIAQAEDQVFFQGTNAPYSIPATNPFPRFLKFANLAGAGLLGIIAAGVATGATTAPVPVTRPAGATTYGSATFDGVVKGITQLIGVGHPGPFALFLSTDIYADTYQTVPAGLTTTADRIRPLVTGGYYATDSLPRPPAAPSSTGILVSLGGEPTTIYIAQDAVTAYPGQLPGGSYGFRVFERVQIVNRDPAALVQLNFV